VPRKLKTPSFLSSKKFTFNRNLSIHHPLIVPSIDFSPLHSNQILYWYPWIRSNTVKNNRPQAICSHQHWCTISLNAHQSHRRHPTISNLIRWRIFYSHWSIMMYFRKRRYYDSIEPRLLTPALWSRVSSATSFGGWFTFFVTDCLSLFRKQWDWIKTINPNAHSSLDHLSMSGWNLVRDWMTADRRNRIQNTIAEDCRNSLYSGS